MFMVLLVAEKSPVSIERMSGPVKGEINLSWATGMVGAIPVFGTYEEAELYASLNKQKNGNFPDIQEMEEYK